MLNKNYNDCSQVQEVEGEEMKQESFIGLVQANHLHPRVIQIILVLQNRPPQNGRLQKHGGSKATSKKPGKSMSHKTTSGKVSHIVKEVLLIPDLSIKAVPKNKKMQEYYIDKLV